jgi:hypothetical protein
MRNFLAHYSSYARRAYYNHMRATYSYKRVPEPGAFLIASLPRAGVPRWASYYLNFYAASKKMMAALA